MQIKINKRSVYAPIRYEATRPFAIHVGKHFIAESKRGEAARMAFVREQLLPLLKRAAAKIGRENGPGPLQCEMVNTQVFGSYMDGGKIIFDLSESLRQTLLITDAEDIPCGELVFPAKCFYLHFGAESGLSNDGVNIEGAFVACLDDRMTIDLVPQGFGQPHFLSLPMGESMIGVSVLLNEPSKLVSQALVDSIADVLAANAKMYEQMAGMERRLERQYGQVVKVPAPVERLAEKGPLLQKALSLIVNTMFYLAVEPQDISDDWGRDTPAEALVALQAAIKPGAVKTIENTLLKAGYSKVRFAGKMFAQSIAARHIREVAESGKTIAAHFRRGHFRRQPYGPERTLRKTIFVAPVLVNAGYGGEAQGRIYAVPPPEIS
ncbi:hypothetical protein [Paracidovorax wautersii]|nr:hypothetical protein [Paracidovorax wautersii]